LVKYDPSRHNHPAAKRCTRRKLLILCILEDGKLCFGEIRKLIPNISERMLTLQLRELEKDGLLKRTVHAEVPLKVDYELSGIAQELITIWLQLSSWGAKHKLWQISENE
jgi:DNA-binding HxlR family transcriptional regulator